MFLASVSPTPATYCKQLDRGRVHVDADGVDAALDHPSSAFFKRRLVHVVLVLADADRLRIDLHQLGQRILQAPPDRHRAAHRDVLVGKLLARHLRRRVDRRARLVDHDDLDARRSRPACASLRTKVSVSRPAVPLPMATASMRCCLHSRSSVAAASSTLRSDCVGIDDVVGLQIALVVDDRDLAAGAKAGIDRQHALAAERRLQAAARAGSRRTP